MRTTVTTATSEPAAISGPQGMPAVSDKDCHMATSPQTQQNTHARTHTPSDRSTDCAAATATRAVDPASEYVTSRRDGTSKAWVHRTQANRTASGTLHRRDVPWGSGPGHREDEPHEAPDGTEGEDGFDPGPRFGPEAIGEDIADDRGGNGEERDGGAQQAFRPARSDPHQNGRHRRGAERYRVLGRTGLVHFDKPLPQGHAVPLMPAPPGPVAGRARAGREPVVRPDPRAPGWPAPPVEIGRGSRRCRP